MPLECSPALNLIGVHPDLIAFARAALDATDVHLYQCQAWAKFTGAADYDQPFHCDYQNHTLVAPAEDARRNTVTFMCYFTDVTEAHGPMHYVPRTKSDTMCGPEATLGCWDDERAAVNRLLAPFARSTASQAGSVFAYGLDLFHRATNLTAPMGLRYALTACFKRAGNDSIGYHAWPFHYLKPWQRLFEAATPEQLACFGVPPPADLYWTDTTLKRAQTRYPGWDLTPYRRAIPGAET